MKLLDLDAIQNREITGAERASRIRSIIDAVIDDRARMATESIRPFAERIKRLEEALQ